MKHIKRKYLTRGAGGGKSPKPEPAILNPPKLGGFKSISSYTVAEIIDLISDGPIEGLVDQKGAKLGRDIFKGIYLDDTPIQNTQTIISNQASSFGSVNISNILNPIAQNWISNGQFKTLSNVNNSEALFTLWAVSIIENAGIEGLYDTWYTVPKFELTGSSNQIVYFGTGRSKFDFNANIEFFSALDTAYYHLYLSNIINNFETKLNGLKQSNNARVLEIINLNINKLNTIRSNANAFALGRRAIPVYMVIDLGRKKIFSNPVPDTEKMEFYIENLSIDNPYVYTLSIPEISNRQYTGNVDSIIIIEAPTIEDNYNIGTTWLTRKLLYSLNRTDLNLVASKSIPSEYQENNSLYNFANVSAQFKNGEEFQESLFGFDNIRVDHIYDKKLLGPFKKFKPIQRINPTPNSFAAGIDGLKLVGTDTTGPLSVSNKSLLLDEEGSKDQRENTGADFSEWNDQNERTDYDSISTTHTIENPLVDSVSVSLVIETLSDVVETDRKDLPGVGDLNAGSKIPSIVAIRIETGKITSGVSTEIEQYTYSIVGLIEGPCVIDFGADYPEADNLLKDSVKLIDGDNLNDSNLTRPFKLPTLKLNDDPTTTKRYIKVLKLSSETNSVLIKKDIKLGKVTEIIDQKFSYPFSAIVGIKLNAKTFANIPARSFDCKLKKIKIPSNYKIEDENGNDIRYVKSKKNYEIPKKIYNGDWDGSFAIGWTDNPAWILYDLLTSKRYGLGSYIDESQVNKWELYKIARFCDAVDDEGYFIGVSDGIGGLEPRFSCNIMFKEQTKVYDAINIIASLFRGVVFFGGSEIHFLDDRPRIPIALFNNANVREGVFNYSNTRRDMQFNTAEVIYLDRFDNYKTKVEYIQDEQDIRKRGVFKTAINTMGVTSRAMARRIGQHVIYQTIKENQQVSFIGGLESLLCRPGDLILIEDELKTRATNYGKILNVNVNNKTIQVDNQFNESQYTGFITFYAPTGYSTSLELEKIAAITRSRVQQFEITGDLLSNSNLKGIYKFSGYTEGFSQSTIYPSQFPLYTGTGSNSQKLFCYYNTGATGFVFATGLPFQNNNIYDKIITNTGVFFAADISSLSNGNSGNYTGFTYDSNISNKRINPGQQISGAIKWESSLYPRTQGILDNEIDSYNKTQIAKISFTGWNNQIDYGSTLSLNTGDPNISFLAAIKPGSIYRIERKNSSDQIYKVLSIRENSQNEYLISASKYDTGKFDTIEKAITEDFLSNTYYNGPIMVGNTQIRQLSTPQIKSFSGFDQTSNNFKLTGQWASVANATGYSVSIDNSLAGYFKSTIINQTGVQFTGLTNIGNWTLSVAALAGSPNINSSTATTGTFVAYTGTNTTSITKPAVVGFSLQ